MHDQKQDIIFMMPSWEISAILFLFYCCICKEPLNDCYQTVTLNTLRVPYLSTINVNHTEKILCVLTNKTSQFRMISISFIPTACIYYRQDQWPEDYSTLNDSLLFKIKVIRDKCVTDEETNQPYAMILKNGITLSQNFGFDHSFIIYFGVGITMSVITYFSIIKKLERSSLFRFQGYEPIG